MDSNSRRRTTVHDVAALRVHRDGTRVDNTDDNRRSRRAKYTVRDARGNWIAKDAGGLGTITSRPNVRNKADQDEAEAEENENQEELHKKDKGKGRAVDSEDDEDIAVNQRAQKRRKFDEDLSFLDPGGSSVLPTGREEEVSTLRMFPVPSSDLLKCLHYFSSTYYSAMGQLYNVGREHRKERKMRRAEKLKKAAIPRSQTSRANTEDIESTEEEDIAEEGEDDDKADDDDAKTDSRNKRSRTRRPIEKDMYKAFDGSALVVLGMLLQEHIGELLKPNIPQGWEKEMSFAEREFTRDARRARKAQGMRRKRWQTKSMSPALHSQDEDREPNAKHESGQEKGDTD